MTIEMDNFPEKQAFAAAKASLRPGIHRLMIRLYNDYSKACRIAKTPRQKNWSEFAEELRRLLADAGCDAIHGI